MMVSSQPTTVLFVHIPKTGGTTLSHVLTQQFPHDRIFHIREPQFSRAPVYSPSHGEKEDFIALPDDQRARYQCVMGHMRVGIHEHLQGPWIYLTMLREPVGRILSHHTQFNRMVSRGEIPGQGPVTLEEFCQVRPMWFHNPQARFLSGLDPQDHPHEQVLDLAQENLKNHIALVGTTDRFDESMLLIGKQMGWSDLSYVSRNVSRRSAAKVVSQPMIEQIRENNQLDLQLYATANQILDQAIAEYGPTFEQDLAAYRHSLVDAAARYKRNRWKRVLGRIFGGFGSGAGQERAQVAGRGA